MKNRTFILLMAVLMLFTTPALANGWGLSGGIVEIVAGNDAYDDYVATADDGNSVVLDEYVNQAILTNRYHSELIAAMRIGGTWEPIVSSTRAVYQPGHTAGTASLEHTDNGFVLAYENERYFFEWWEHYGDYVLIRAEFGPEGAETSSLYFGPVDVDDTVWEMTLWQGTGNAETGAIHGDALWRTEPLGLSEFNISLMPRTIQDVRQMYSVGGTLDAWEGKRLAFAEKWEGVEKGINLPVYSAPNEDSFRAAKGKASVSTGGDMLLLGEYGEWTLVNYQVSERTSRIGFVHANLMTDSPTAEPFALPIHEDPVPLYTLRETYLTDDPFVSQYAQVRIPAGAQVEGLAALDDFYAYVSYEQSGTLYWGFVPLRDLIAPSWEMDLPGVDRDITGWTPLHFDIMDRLIGKWDVQTGEGLLPERIVLYADTAYELRDGRYGDSNVEMGRWRLIACPEGSKYAGVADYQLTFVNEVNEEIVCGLVIEDPFNITLLTEDGTTTYFRSEFSTYGNG